VQFSVFLHHNIHAIFFCQNLLCGDNYNYDNALSFVLSMANFGYWKYLKLLYEIVHILATIMQLQIDICLCVYRILDIIYCTPTDISTVFLTLFNASKSIINIFYKVKGNVLLVLN
jgi:hypothetical protein